MTLDEGMIRVDPETGEVLDGIDISGEELAHYGMPRRSGRTAMLVMCASKSTSHMPA